MNQRYVMMTGRHKHGRLARAEEHAPPVAVLYVHLTTYGYCRCTKPHVTFTVTLIPLHCVGLLKSSRAHEPSLAWSFQASAGLG